MKNLRILILLIGVLFSVSSLSAEEFSLLLTSQLRVAGVPATSFFDHEIYMIDNVPYPSSLERMRMEEQETYEFEFEFAYFAGNEMIDCNNFIGKGYQLFVSPSKEGTFQKKGGMQGSFRNIFFLDATEKVNTEDTLFIELYDRNKNLAFSAFFPLEILPKPDPLAGGTQVIIKNQIFKNIPAVARLSERDNPLNMTQSMLNGSFIPDTILLKAGKTYNLDLELEKWIPTGQNEEGISIVVNAEKHYGFKVNYEWTDGALALRKTNRNGLSATITTVPRSGGVVKPVDPNLILLEDINMQVVRVDPNFIPQKETQKQVIKPVILDKPSKIRYDSKVWNPAYHMKMDAINKKKLESQRTKYKIDKTKIIDSKTLNQLKFQRMQMVPAKTKTNKTKTSNARINTNTTYSRINTDAARRAKVYQPANTITRTRPAAKREYYSLDVLIFEPVKDDDYAIRKRIVFRVVE